MTVNGQWPHGDRTLIYILSLHGFGTYTIFIYKFSRPLNVTISKSCIMEFFEEDPAADFLSREQEAIGDVLGGDNFEVIADNTPPPAPETLFADQGLGELNCITDI